VKRRLRIEAHFASRMEEPSDSEEGGTGFMRNANTRALNYEMLTFKSVVLVLLAASVSVYLMYPVHQGTKQKN
jgi:hypothetical protein